MNFKIQIKYILVLSISFMMLGCNQGDKVEAKIEEAEPPKAEAFKLPDFYLEGHRGARGLSPENTIPSMLRAVKDGANVLELDIHFSKDKKVVVAHDPYINAKFSDIPSDHKFPTNDKDRIILYTLDYSDIKTFDVGSKKNEAFPLQENEPAHIPLLSELIDSVEAYIKTNNLIPVIYNIEVKSNEKYDGINHPEPRELIDLTMAVLESRNLEDRFYIQSFDARQIQAVKESNPDVVVGFLTSDGSKTYAEQIEFIGFVPEIFSPHFKMATPELVQETHSKGSKFIPWTVNKEEDMIAMLDLNVDGIITDFPGRLKEIRNKVDD